MTALQPGCRVKMTKEMFTLKCMWDGNKQQTYKTTPGRDDSEKMIRQGCRGDPWGRDQKVKKEPTRPGKNRDISEALVEEGPKD